MHKPQILLVEDEAAIADAVVYALQLDGCEASWVETAGAALAHLAVRSVDLAILDIGLPDASGLELLRRIRAERDLPVLILSARGAELDRVVGLELGADDYVTKPFSPRELTARVKTVLRRSQRAAPPPQVSPAPAALQHDPERRQFVLYGEPLLLTRAEYDLLAVLAARPGRVFSRDALLDRVWREGDEPLDRTIDTHIKTLRAKVARLQPQLELVVTHRGIGYALADPLPPVAAPAEPT